MMKKIILPLKGIVILCILFIRINIQSQTFIQDVTVREMVNIGDMIYFSGANEHGFTLWKTDGTKEGTSLVKRINEIEGNDISNLTVFNNEVYFSASDGAIGVELWKSDGTKEGTVLVKNIHEWIGNSSNPSNFVIVNNALYFTATDHFINGSFQLWKTDGTENGTVKVYDGGGSRINNLVVVNDRLYLDMGNLYEFNFLTNELDLIEIDEFSSISELNSFNGSLYFITHTSYRKQIRLYKLDGTNKAILLQEFEEPQGGDIDIKNITLVDDTIYFTILTDFSYEQETDDLWKSDGTFDGTVKLKTFNWDRHSSGSNISNFIAFNNELIFSGGADNNFTIWKSDGTSLGTQMIINKQLDYLIDMVVNKDLLYFSSETNLWSTDGTEINTQKVSNLRIRNNSSEDTFNIKSVNETVYFESSTANSEGLYSINENPILEVGINYNKILEFDEELYYKSKIDSITYQKVYLKNNGTAPIYLAKIEIIGKDFYLNERPNVISRTILPSERVEFETSFFPSTSGLKEGVLKILSNDIETPDFSINLLGFANEELSESSGLISDLSKEIIFDSSVNKLKISNNSIDENSEINSVIGTLSVSVAGNYSFELTNDNNDNSSFIVVNNELRSNADFNYEVKNTYLVRVEVTNADSNESFEEEIIIQINGRSKTSQTLECPINIENFAYGLSAVEFLDDSNVIAVGTHGTILKSVDSGENWKKIYIPLAEHLIDVRFSSEAIGFIITSNQILKSKDKGETWELSRIPKEIETEAKFSKIEFVNEKVGFVFGLKGEILKTVDAGESWGLIKSGGNSLFSGYFINEMNGFICGKNQTLLRTKDGGKTWEEEKLENSELKYNSVFTSISFITESIGFIGASDGQILKTTDGGNSWVFDRKLELNGVTKINFIDEFEGYLLDIAGTNRMFKTTDGGENWEEVLFDYLYSSFNDISFNKNGGASVIVGNGSGCCSGYNTGSLIYTKNVSNEWLLNSYLSLKSDDLVDVNFYNNYAFVVSEKELFRSINNGITWEKLDAPEEYIKRVKIIDSNVYVLGQYGFYISSDYGENWTKQSTLEHTVDINFINSDTFYALTHLGVFKSKDRGITWLESGLQTEGLFDMYFLNEMEGHVAGVSGLFKTIDGGVNWTKAIVAPPVNGGEVYFYSVHFFDSNLGMAGSSKGLLKTEDGGINWEQTDKNVGGTPRFIHAYNADDWIIISNGRIVRSTDGGDSWVTIYHEREINKVQYFEDKFIIVGDETFKKLHYNISHSGERQIIKGNSTVSMGSKEYYRISNNENFNYRWEVTGNHDIVYSNNSAQILWNSVGVFQISVTPFNSCETKPTIRVNVEVVDVHLNPKINGSFNVVEFSKNIEYSTELNSGSGYIWNFSGHESFRNLNNNVQVDWASAGVGTIQVIETHKASGIRMSDSKSVVINGLQIPSNNFEIEVFNETCPNKENGIIHIKALIELNYVATINNKSFEFSNELTIENLTSGTHNLCITVSEKQFEQCFEINVIESTTLTGKASVKSNMILINMSGGTLPYTVSKNGIDILKTNSKEFSLAIKNGDVIAVKSNKICEGTFVQTILAKNEIIANPNPTAGSITIHVPVDDGKIQVELFTVNSVLVYSGLKQVQNNKTTLDISNNVTGIYYLKVYTEEPKIIKIIKI